ncbi:nucleotide-diphospho-sugar transferase [Gautieria morchelliformis]|nr:nucleotide-diphospho-sugar transferase [Gautieria morchelliformis]
MDTVADEALPVCSASKPLQLLQSSSLRRRKLIVALAFFAGLVYIVSGRLTLFVRQRTPVPIALDDNPLPTVALSSLGLEAEEVYHLGSLSLPSYKSSLQAFIDTAFPSSLKARLSSQLDRFLDFESSDPLPERPKHIWQTNDILPPKPGPKTWPDLNPDHEYHFLYDDDADEWVRRNFKDSAIEWTWNFLPHAVLKADFLRYLLLLVEGGTYSDIDTECLKPITRWGHGADIVQSAGSGSMPGTIVGVEADVGDRADWHDWWARPLQIVQWTMSSSPGHPLFLDTVRRIYARTVEAERNLRADASIDAMGNLDKNMSVLEWTGPAVFTDATLRFLRIEAGLKWVDLRGLDRPLQAGSVIVLPVTGFSPGVGNFGSKQKTDDEAMVQHYFSGSWRPHSDS